HAGNDLGEGAEGHQLDDAHVGHIAHGVLAGEHSPGLLAAVLHAQRDPLLLGVEADDVHVHLVAHGDNLSGVLDAGPGQLGDVDHAVHTADVHEGAVRGQALHGTGVVLAHLDVGPNLGSCRVTVLSGHGQHGAQHAA